MHGNHAIKRPESGSRFCLDARGTLHVEHIRFFAPALAEHGVQLAADRDDIERLAIALVKALPLGDARAIAAHLRRAIQARRGPWLYEFAGEPGDFRHFSASYGFAKLLAVVIELDGEAEDTRALCNSEDPNVAMTLVEHARGVLHGDWPIGRRTEAGSLDAIVPRLERLSVHGDRTIRETARALLGR